jgi:hypothetical protein
MARRREWFEKMETVHQVLFWVPAGHLPTLQEAMNRLDHLNRHGPSPTAFTFKARFPHPGKEGGPHDMKPEPYCSV